MKEITILSGKGGTGKTSITAALALVAQNAVLCDNDVDAADLHLLLQPEVKEKNVFLSAWISTIHSDKCTACGLCLQHCHFDAIYRNEEGVFEINPYKCEGCRLCERVCPANAISSERSANNFWYVSETRAGIMIHAKMGVGEENSGKLVTVVRKKAREIAAETKAEFVINDGPPGIGCAAIASITGTDKVLLIIEPTKSGLHDAVRLIELLKNFKIQIFAVINKYNINEEIAQNIAQVLQKKKIPLIDKIPFDKTMVKAMVEGKTIVEYKPHSRITASIHNIWETIRKD